MIPVQNMSCVRFLLEGMEVNVSNRDGKETGSKPILDLRLNAYPETGL